MANEEHVAILKKGVATWNAWRRKNPAIRPDLSGANLGEPDPVLEEKRYEEERQKRKREARLVAADLSGADLSGANLSRALLLEANLTKAKIAGADLREARLGGTVFGHITLSEVKGLDQCAHHGPSIIDFQTLQASGPLPIAFLRG